MTLIRGFFEFCQKRIVDFFCLFSHIVRPNHRSWLWWPNSEIIKLHGKPSVSSFLSHEFADSVVFTVRSLVKQMRNSIRSCAAVGTEEWCISSLYPAYEQAQRENGHFEGKMLTQTSNVCSSSLEFAQMNVERSLRPANIMKSFLQSRFMQIRSICDSIREIECHKFQGSIQTIQPNYHKLHYAVFISIRILRSEAQIL